MLETTSKNLAATEAAGLAGPRTGAAAGQAGRAPPRKSTLPCNQAIWCCAARMTHLGRPCKRVASSAARGAMRSIPPPCAAQGRVRAPSSMTSATVTALPQAAISASWATPWPRGIALADSAVAIRRSGRTARGPALRVSSPMLEVVRVRGCQLRRIGSRAVVAGSSCRCCNLVKASRVPAGREWMHENDEYHVRSNDSQETASCARHGQRSRLKLSATLGRILQPVAHVE